MLQLTDENLATLQTVAAPIAPKLRARFLEDVAAACRGKPDLGERNVDSSLAIRA
jgi:hypothetical protein